MAVNEGGVSADRLKAEPQCACGINIKKIFTVFPSYYNIVLLMRTACGCDIVFSVYYIALDLVVFVSITRLTRVKCTFFGHDRK